MKGVANLRGRMEIRNLLQLMFDIVMHNTPSDGGVMLNGRDSLGIQPTSCSGMVRKVGFDGLQREATGCLILLLCYASNHAGIYRVFGIGTPVLAWKTTSHVARFAKNIMFVPRKRNVNVQSNNASFAAWSEVVPVV